MAEVNREERSEGCGEGALGGSALAAGGPAYAEILKTHLAYWIDANVSPCRE